MNYDRATQQYSTRRAYNRLMVADEFHDVLFVIAPFRAEMNIPRAFQMRLSTVALARVNKVIASGKTWPFLGRFSNGVSVRFVAKATRSHYGFIQLEPVCP